MVRILTKEQVVEIKKLLKEGVKINDIASKFNVSRQAIGCIKAGRNWKDV